MTANPSGDNGKEASANRKRPRPRAGTLGGSNKMLSAREVAAILSVPERTIREKWRDWELPAYRIRPPEVRDEKGHHLRERD